MKATTRTRLGRHFREGHRLAWIAIRKRRWTQKDLADRLGEPQTKVFRWLWGDAEIPLTGAVKIEDELGIDCALFVRPVRKPFQPSAVAA